MYIFSIYVLSVVAWFVFQYTYSQSVCSTLWLPGRYRERFVPATRATNAGNCIWSRCRWLSLKSSNFWWNILYRSMISTSLQAANWMSSVDIGRCFQAASGTFKTDGSPPLGPRFHNVGVYVVIQSSTVLTCVGNSSPQNTGSIPLTSSSYCCTSSTFCSEIPYCRYSTSDWPTVEGNLLHRVAFQELFHTTLEHRHTDHQ